MSRRAISAGLRFEVLHRDGFTCRYCGASGNAVELHIDHVRPVIDGGQNEITNLVTACSDCNVGKGTKALIRRIPELVDRESPFRQPPYSMEDVQDILRTVGLWEDFCRAHPQVSEGAAWYAVQIAPPFPVFEFCSWFDQMLADGLPEEAAWMLAKVHALLEVWERDGREAWAR